MGTQLGSVPCGSRRQSRDQRAERERTPRQSLALTWDELLGSTLFGMGADRLTKYPPPSRPSSRARNKWFHGGTWVARSVEHLTSAQVTISRFVSSSPTWGSLLSVSAASTSDPLSSSFCPSPACAFPQINKYVVLRWFHESFCLWRGREGTCKVGRCSGVAGRPHAEGI